MTTDFFDQMATSEAWLESSGARWATLLIAEHLLIGTKLLIDFVVPDVPDKVRVKLHRDEYFAAREVLEDALRAAGAPSSTEGANAPAAAPAALARVLTSGALK